LHSVVPRCQRRFATRSPRNRSHAGRDRQSHQPSKCGQSGWVRSARGQVVVRPRSNDDLDPCESLARTVHAFDGYPAFIRNDDFRRFIAAPDAVAAWVGERDGEIVGHVAVHPSTIRPAMALASSRLGVVDAQLAVIARLMVDPGERRRGIAHSLLETAVAAARERGFVPILDVVTQYDAAVALYESAGWDRLGTVGFSLPDGTTIEEFVYQAPR
jgi:GNAT superfamily N-acetyltransferase